MTIEDNIKFAKRDIVTQIYTAARIEGLNVTYPETEVILRGQNVARLNLDEIQVIQNLRDGWKYVLENVTKPLDIEFILKVNGYVARNESFAPGVLRTGVIGIGGTSWKPEVPNPESVKKTISLLAGMSPQDQAIEYFLYGTKKQLFWDGNKRSSYIISNKLLIEKGYGLLVIPDSRLLEFTNKLHDFYEYDKSEGIKSFLQSCLVGNDVVFPSHCPGQR